MWDKDVVVFQGDDWYKLCVNIVAVWNFHSPFESKVVEKKKNSICDDL